MNVEKVLQFSFKINAASILSPDMLRCHTYRQMLRGCQRCPGDYGLVEWNQIGKGLCGLNNPPGAQRAELVYLLPRDATQVHANLQELNKSQPPRSMRLRMIPGSQYHSCWVYLIGKNACKRCCSALITCPAVAGTMHRNAVAH